MKCNLGTIKVGGSVVINVVGTVDSNTSGPLVNYAEVTDCCSLDYQPEQ